MDVPSLRAEQQRLHAALAANRAEPDADDVVIDRYRMLEQLAAIEGQCCLLEGDATGAQRWNRIATGWAAEYTKARERTHLAIVESYRAAFEAIERQALAAQTLADLEELENPAPPDTRSYAIPAWGVAKD